MHTLDKIQKYFLFFFELFLLMVASSVRSQEMLGAVNSNYAGMNGLLVNPSSMVDSRLKFDINLLTIGASVDNNYLYIPKENLSFFGFGKISDALHHKYTGYTDAKKYDSTDLSKPVKGQGSVFARVPGIMFNIGGNFFALQAIGRAAFNASNVPMGLAKFLYEDQTFNYIPLLAKPFSFDNVKLDGMTWMEFGLSYGHDILRSSTDYLNGAITIKRLVGIAGGYVRASASNFTSVNGSCSTCYTLVSLNSQIDYAGNQSVVDSSTSAGYGWGFDIGFTYEYRPEQEQHYYNMDGKRLQDPEQNQYKWRVGFSLIDLGKIKFPNSGVYHQDGLLINQKDQKIGTLTATNFDMALPHAMSLQVDWHLAHKWYSNLTWRYAITTSTPGPVANNLLALSPRYERRNLEAALPISLVEYHKLRVGLALRIWGLTVGTDRLGPLLGLNDMSGMDVYASLRIPIYKRRISDRDHDEVSDALDRCPDVKGTWFTLGCPDRDGDGIVDKDDSCPDIKGLAQFHGCPDTDGDGIPDQLDSCPGLAGLAQFHGCPDTDGDGVEDKLDSCPKVAGLPQFHGCPDTDSDGIPDPLDSCPLVAGPESNHGCPIVEKVIKPKEQVKVELSQEEQEVINKVFSNLEFETGKSVIRSASYSSLDALATLLTKKPKFKLLIEGHTDNVGSAASNMKLSNNRAEAVKTYLVNKGIDPTRITAKGYGLTRPVASNKTPEGRQKNRRVEFTVVE